MELRPLKNNVLLFIGNPKNIKMGNLIIPHHVKSLNASRIEGRVIAIGPGAPRHGRRFPMEDIQIGDLVVVHKFAGRRFLLEDQLCMTVKDREILAILDDESYIEEQGDVNGESIGVPLQND